MITGIVVALPEELGTLTAKKIEKGQVEHVTEKMLLVCSGVGSDNASASAELLVKQGANRLISWGCAAALDATLKPGDLVLAESYVDADRVSFDLNNKDWVSHINAELSKNPLRKPRIGMIAESKSIVATGREKAQIAKSTGAMALDMESASIARVARSYGLPFLAIRAIADPLGMDLPKAISYALNSKGEVVISKLLGFVLTHPAEIPGLIKLGLHFYAARKTLKFVAKQLQYGTTLPQNT